MLYDISMIMILCNYHDSKYANSLCRLTEVPKGGKLLFYDLGLSLPVYWFENYIALSLYLALITSSKFSVFIMCDFKPIPMIL